MAGRSFHLGCAAYCAVFAVAVAGSTAGCQKQGPPALRKIKKSGPTGQPGRADNGVKYRRRSGQDIAPQVIADEPAPSEALTGAAAGAQAGNVTLNGDPNGITRETLNRSIQSSMGALASCFTNITQDPMVAVSFEADPSGRPSLVRVRGAPPDAERCIRNVVQSMRFPSFQGKGVQVDLPLSFHRSRTAGPPQPAGPQPAQPAGPPLFIEP